MYEELPEGGEDTLASYVEVCIDGEEEEGEGEEGHSSRFVVKVFLCDFMAGFWIRIHLIRIRFRIQHFRLNTDPDPDPGF